MLSLITYLGWVQTNAFFFLNVHIIYGFLPDVMRFYDVSVFLFPARGFVFALLHFSHGKFGKVGRHAFCSLSLTLKSRSHMNELLEGLTCIWRQPAG